MTILVWLQLSASSGVTTPSGPGARTALPPVGPEAAKPPTPQRADAADATAARVAAIDYVQLRCVDQFGKPVPGGTAFVVPGMPRQVVEKDSGWTARADGAGVVDCSPLRSPSSTTPADAHVLVVAPGYAPAAVALPALLAARVMELRLDAAAAASVTLRDLSGDPVARTAVVAYRGTRPVVDKPGLPGAGPDDVHVAISDENGLAVFGNCRSDVYGLLVGVPDGWLTIVAKDPQLDLRSAQPTPVALVVAPLMGAAVRFAPEAPQRLVLPADSAFASVEAAEGNGLLAKSRLAARFPTAMPVVVLGRRCMPLNPERVAQRFQAEWSRSGDAPIDVDLGLQPIARISDVQEVRIANPQHANDGELKVTVIDGAGAELSGITFFAQKVGSFELRSVVSSTPIKLPPGKYTIRVIGGPSLIAGDLPRTVDVGAAEMASVVFKLEYAIRNVEFKVQYEDGSMPQAVTLGVESAIGSSNLNSIRPACIPEVVAVGPCKVVVVAAGLKPHERQVVIEPGPWTEPQRVTLTIPK